MNGVCSRGGREADAAHCNALEVQTPLSLESCEKNDAYEKRDKAVAQERGCVAPSGRRGLAQSSRGTPGATVCICVSGSRG